MVYRLNVHKIEQSCLFELTWGQGQRIPASLPYPAQLTTLYQTWRQAYIGYYRQALRGRVAAAGQVATSQVDWHSQVVQAEARLLSEFHRWLRHEALFDLRAELVKGQTARLEGSGQTPLARMELFLACAPLELARLPWETWEIGADLGQQGQIQIVRSPATIRSGPSDRPSFRHGKTRVLAILGDEQGLDFEGDRTALNAQRPLLEVHYVGWQPGQDTLALKETICREIASPQGWDVLFFAGHSNEAALVDGQIAIAPNTAIALRELTPYLTQAKQRGLQFAFFNSCSGLDIANGLIDLGLSQVAILREPIHNEVAHSFLRQFLHRLARLEDVQTALMGACQFLKLEKNLTYPSAHLVPSLFRHPDSIPYRIQPGGWRYQVQRWRPKWREAIAVSVLALVSLQPPLQNWLLDYRVWTQAVYRDWTGQTVSPAPSPVLLVQIDTQTLRQRQLLGQANPIDRTLLADLIATLVDREARVIGIDYLLDSHDPVGNPILRQTLEQAIVQRGVWFVFGATWDSQGQWQTVLPEIAAHTWSLEGDAYVPFWHLLPKRRKSSSPAPFSYQLVAAHALTQTPGNDDSLLRPRLQSQIPLQQQLEDFFGQFTGPGDWLSPRAYLHPLTNFSYGVRQRWLQPLLDFSLPPEQVYQRIPAWQLLETPDEVLRTLGDDSLGDRVIIIAAGGYDAAGLDASDGDSVVPPPAFAYWQIKESGMQRQLTLGESHGYMTHHLLTSWLVVPIPDLGVILLAAIAGKALSLHLAMRSKHYSLRWVGILGGGTLGYGLVSLQLYITGAVMLPWLLPSFTVWCFVWPTVWEKST